MKIASLALALACALVALPSRAGTFDALGEYQADPSTIAELDFSTPPARYVPPDADPSCKDPMFTIVKGDDALDSGSYARVKVKPGCAERLIVALPAKQASYRATMWMRHGALEARMAVIYQQGTNLDIVFAMLAPTGRTTSDGWVELASNDFSVDGAKVEEAYVRLDDYAWADGTDIDALEILESGSFVAQTSCTGRSDPTCTDGFLCIYDHCVDSRGSVPPLPSEGVRNAMVDVLEGKLRIFFGGQRSRALYLPKAIETMEGMRLAKTAFAFWNGWATAIHELHDWHTDSYGLVGSSVQPHGRLNACFIEGDADLSHAIWPSDPRYLDVLVSHVGTDDTAGLVPGDRLVAVDGVHPIEWAQGLASREWGYHVATDPDTYSDLVEALGGPFWIGGASMLKWASTITVIHCDPATAICDPIPETIDVASLASDATGSDVVCDNRPQYHLQSNGPDPTKHQVFDKIFRSRITDTADAEQIFGMVWDNLYGGNDPMSYVNSNIAQAIDEWKAGARGVILDHRAGNGGTLDAPTNITKLVRPPDIAGVIRMPLDIAGYSGPIDDADGIAIFASLKSTAEGFAVGDAAYDPLLPVALVTHRDGSASDFMPYAMKGAPKVKLFGPHQTAGAFSTFINFTMGDGIAFQFASGDMVGPDGRAAIGHGVQPDFVVEQKQSDLLAGKDTIHEAALAWLRTELKP